MTVNYPSRKSLIEQRRAIVAGLRLKGCSQREIIKKLEADGHLNPDTNKPWSLGIINGDIKNIEKQWQDQAIEDTSKHKARQIAEINEVKKYAWASREFAIILKCIDQEANLLGTKAPIKQEHTGKDGDAIKFEGDPTAKDSLLALLVEEATKGEVGSANSANDPRTCA